jgi:hypothetical protein
LHLQKNKHTKVHLETQKEQQRNEVAWILSRQLKALRRNAPMTHHSKDESIHNEMHGWSALHI